MTVHVIKGWDLTVVQIHADDGRILPALDIAFHTQTDPGVSEMVTWPRFRLIPHHGPELLQKIQAALDRIEAGDFSGPGTIQ